MRTGEGKTLVATAPVYLNALEGRGVHVITVNDYLASRDAEWMGKVYRFLGMSVGKIVHGLDDAQRRASYACDITYGTNNEFGFDYLRDNMKYSLADMVQRGHRFAMVDEVDSILVDESRTPLIISGPTDDRSELYQQIDAIIPLLSTGRLHARREGPLGRLLRKRQREDRRADGAGRHPAGLALRTRQHLPRPPREPGAARPQAVPEGQGLHRQERRGDAHRRVHRPHDAGPPPLGRPPPGHRGEGEDQDPAREPDAGLDHLPELFPPLRQARRHDRHGLDRGGRILRHLQAGSHRDPDQQAGQADRRGRRRLPDREREIQGDHRRHPRLRAPQAARAGRHGLDREVGNPLQPALGRTHPAPGAERPPPRARSLHHRPGRRAGRRHRRHQHGRPRHRHPARRQCRHALADRGRSPRRETRPRTHRGRD